MQSEVIKVLLLGDNHVVQNYLHRLVFTEEVNYSEMDVGDSTILHSSSYLIDDKKCYTLQFCEVQTDDDLQNCNYPNLPDSESAQLIVIAFDTSTKTTSLQNISRIQKQYLHSLPPLLLLIAKNNSFEKPEEW